MMNAISDVSWLHTKEKNDVVKKKNTSLFETLKNRFWHFTKRIWCIVKKPSTLLSYIHKAFWINLVIHMCNKRRVLGITLLQTPKIMPIFLCVRRDKLWKNDPCLSRAGVRLERKRSEDAGQMISDCFCVSKCHLHRLAQIMAQSKKRGHSAQIVAQHKKRGHSNS